MVLAGDMAATSRQVESRDVVGTVTVLQLDSTSASRKSQKLVAQTDTEDGNLRCLHQTAKVVGGVLAVGGVTGAVGDEDTIEVVSDLVNGVIKGEHSNTSSAVHEATQDVLLDTTVEHSDMALRVGSTDVEWRLGADLANKVDLLGVGESLILVGIILLADGDTSKGGTLLSEIGDDGASVDSRDSRDTLTRAPFAEALNGGPVRVLFRSIGHNHTSRLEVGRFEVLQKAARVFGGGWNTIVTNQRLGENQDLTPVRRVSQGFRITNQGGGEDGLSGDVGTGAEGLPVEDRTITDRECCPLSGSLGANSSHEATLERRAHGSCEGRSPGGNRPDKSGEHHIYVDNIENIERGCESMVELEAIQ